MSIISKAKQVQDEWTYKVSHWSLVSPQAFPLPPPKKNTKQQHEVELFGVLTHELSIYQTLGFHHHVLGLSLTSRQRCVWNQTNRSLVRVRQKDKKKKSYIIILILFTTAIFQLVLWICNCEVYIPKSPLMQDNVADVIKERFPLRTAWARRRTLQ